ncbi:MAG: hypothetical protein K0S33_2775 [Bacteroidetes bacterium]|jgi:outer membrane protein|nr:hypothetical protein [Bacteroidota bacterium]
MKKVYSIGIGAVVVLALGLYFLLRNDSNKIAWVEVNKVYNEFDGKKELDAKFMKAESARKKIIDSLELDLKLIFNQLQISPENKEKNILFETKRSYFLNKKQELEEDSENMQANYYEQIVNQINQYAKEYGIEKKYSVILGANGEGAVMYAEEEINVTKDMITYINTKYKGL